MAIEIEKSEVIEGITFEYCPNASCNYQHIKDHYVDRLISLINKKSPDIKIKRVRFGTMGDMAFGYMGKSKFKLLPLDTMHVCSFLTR